MRDSTVLAAAVLLLSAERREMNEISETTRGDEIAIKENGLLLDRATLRFTSRQ